MQNPIDSLRQIVQRGAAFAEEQDAIAAALQVLSLDPTEGTQGHPLAALHRMLRVWERNGGMIYLSHQQRKYLRQSIYLLERNLDAGTIYRLQLGALADRLRLMARRHVACADNFKDVDQALDILSPVYQTQPEEHPLHELHGCLSGIPMSEGIRQLSDAECDALVAAARALDERARAPISPI